MKYLHNITTLIDLQILIMEMQSILIKARNNGANEEQLKASVERIDRLIAIYDGYSDLYTSANFYAQRCQRVEGEKMVLNNTIIEQAKEIEKLNAELEWQK